MPEYLSLPSGILAPVLEQYVDIAGYYRVLLVMRTCMVRCVRRHGVFLIRCTRGWRNCQLGDDDD